MIYTPHPMFCAVFATLRTKARILNNRLFPIGGFDLLLRLENAGYDGLSADDLADLGPEGAATALRWLRALSVEGLVEKWSILTFDERYVLTPRGMQAMDGLTQDMTPEL